MRASPKLGVCFVERGPNNSKDKIWVELGSKDWLQLDGFSYREKGPDLNKVSGEPILIMDIFNTFLFIFQFVEVQEPQCAGMNSCSFLKFREPQSFS